MSASSSDDDDDDDVVEASKSALKEFRHKFGPYSPQIITGIFVEVAWCACIGGWLDRAEKASANSSLLEELDLNQRDESNVKEINWILFLVCLAGRYMAILLWFRKHRRHERCTVTASAASAMYIFFSVSQWVYYFGAYYSVLDDLTTVTFAPQVQVKRIASPDATPVANATNMTDGAIDVVNASDAVLNMTMSYCLEKHAPLDCLSKVNRHVTCKVEFDPDVCSGYTWMGRGEDRMKCCVKDIYSLTHPDVPVPFLGISLDAAFMLLKWLAVLSISWTLKDLPIVPKSAQSSGFLNGCWLDLMDSVVFGAYLVNDKVMFPNYGIVYGSGTAAQSQDHSTIDRLRLTWFVAFVLATLSPVVYTFCSRSGEGEGASGAPHEFAQSAESLVRSLQLLDRQSALDRLEECLEIQREAYAQQSAEANHSLMVYVAPEESGGPIGASPSLGRFSAGMGVAALRPGKATTLRGGTYQIMYTDGGSDDEIVPVSRVYPDVKGTAQSSAFGPGCCKGWCGAAGLDGDFQRKAAVIDAIRSLFFLEVPFFLWRFYFEWDGLTIGSFVIILMLKNLVWAIMDFLTILSCGDSSVTCLGMMPVSMLSEALEGSQLSSVWVGPAGLFSLAAEAERKQVAMSIEAQRSKLNARKAWLIIERQKAEDDHDAEARAVLTTEIERVEGQLEGLNVQEKMNHG